jgi:molecular chaperone GrpE
MSDTSKEFETREDVGIGENAEKQNERFMVNVESSDPEAMSPSPKPAGEPTTAPEARLADMQTELDKYKDAALRATADLDNYRKRVAREREESIKYANTGFLERLIPILDNFELGLQAARTAFEGSPILDGMTMVYKQLQDFLTNSGVENIDASGQTFDPNVHEALAQEESADVPEGKVIRQVRKGYRLRDRLLRPANVVVSKGVSHSVVATKEGER